ncbi:hypothetical protein [Exiguobacterium acetylicum]|uniref:hypothetical protein n=1 Tax=Exiguobacterium acetylicum TaxID=41170 RepID=UPI001EE31D53|nr:hypothetical protein [Exiguobacterium acetylicum]UKS57872.1 hypothetical protein K6T22_16690 [Exiguobacterium acetylicum]
MRMVEMSHNPYDRITKINYMRRDLMKDSKLSRFQFKPFDEWYGEVIDYLIDELNEETFSLRFLGKKTDYDHLKIISNRYQGVDVFHEEIMDDDERIMMIREILNQLKEGPVESLRIDESGLGHERVSDANLRTLVITNLDEVKIELFKSLFETATTDESHVPYMTSMKRSMDGGYIHFNHIRSIDLLESWNPRKEVPRQVIYFTDEEAEDETFEIVSRKINGRTGQTANRVERIVLGSAKTERPVEKYEGNEVGEAIVGSTEVNGNKKGGLFSRLLTNMNHHWRDEKGDEHFRTKKVDEEERDWNIRDESIDERVIFAALERYATQERDVDFLSLFKTLETRLRVAHDDVEERITGIKKDVLFFKSDERIEKSQQEFAYARAIEGHLKAMLDVNRRVDTANPFESRMATVLRRYDRSIEDAKSVPRKTNIFRMIELVECANLELQNLQLDAVTGIEYEIASLFRERFERDVEKYIHLVNDIPGTQQLNSSTSAWRSRFEIPEILIEEHKASDGMPRARLLLKPATETASWNLFGSWRRPFDEILAYEGSMRSFKDESFKTYQENVGKKVRDTYGQAARFIESLEDAFKTYLIRELRKAEEVVQRLEAGTSLSEKKRQSDLRNIEELTRQFEWIDAMQKMLSSVIELRPNLASERGDGT